MAPKYRPGATDADGREYLTAAAGAVLGSRVYNTEGGAWGNPLTSGFKGAARDGYWYANGVQAAWGDFGDVAGGVRDASWSTMDPAETMQGFPYRIKSYSTECYRDANRNAVSMVGTNRARLSSPDQVAYKTTNALSTAFRGCLVGNFDVEAPLYSWGGSSDWIPSAVALVVFSGQAAWFSANALVRGAAPGTRYTAYQYEDDGGDGTSYGGAGGSWTPTVNAKLAITRSGNVFNAYYDAGGGGGRVLIGTRTASRKLKNSRLCVAVAHSQVFAIPYYGASGANCAPYAEVGINLVSGTFSNRPSWATKLSTADRGSRPDFPENVLLTWTAKEVSLIDLDNEKLWYRPKNPQGGSYRMFTLPGFAGTTSIVDAWLDTDLGILFVSLYDSATATKGVVVAFDFSKDTIDCFHNSTTDFSIGTSFEMQYNAYYPWEQRTCQFDYPNGGDPNAFHDKWAYSHNWKNWQTQGDQNRVGATWDDATYRYAAIATRNGLRVIRHLLAKTDSPGSYATWTGASDVRSIAFTDGGDLVFADATNVYVVNKATWQAGLGGTFSAGTTIVHPGTISASSQYKLIPSVDAGGVFVARDEGVYFMATGGSSFTLYYGGAGSGATKETLPVYTKVTSFDIQHSDTTDHPVYVALTQAGPAYRILGFGWYSDVVFIDEDVTATMGAETIDVSSGGSAVVGASTGVEVLAGDPPVLLPSPVPYSKSNALNAFRAAVEAIGEEM